MYVTRLAFDVAKSNTLACQGHTIFDDIEPDLDVEQDEEEEEEDEVEEFDHLDEPIPEEDEEDAELLSPDNQTLAEEDEPVDSQVVIAPEAPILDFTLPSPCDFSIPIPSS